MSDKCYLNNKLRLLLAGSKFEELLDDVVAEYICHEAVGFGLDLLEYSLLLVGRSPLQLLLNEPGAVLVLRELHDVVCDLPQLEVGEAVVPDRKSSTL